MTQQVAYERALGKLVGLSIRQERNDQWADYGKVLLRATIPYV